VIINLRRYALGGKYQDLFILLSWAAILTGILLNTFYRAPGARQLTINVHGLYTCQGAIPCQTFWDLGLFFAAAFGAGFLLTEERLVVAGFAPVHLASTGLFALSLTAPVLLGLAQAPLSEPILQLTLVTAFALQFPLAVILSLMGCVFGGFLRSQVEFAT